MMFDCKIDILYLVSHFYNQLHIHDEVDCNNSKNE